MDTFIAYVIQDSIQKRYLAGSSQHPHWFQDLRLAKLFINPPLDILWDLQAQSVKCQIQTIRIAIEK